MKIKWDLLVLLFSSLVLAAWTHGSSSNFLLDGSSVILTTASGDQLAGN